MVIKLTERTYTIGSTFAQFDLKKTEEDFTTTQIVQYSFKDGKNIEIEVHIQNQSTQTVQCVYMNFVWCIPFPCSKEVQCTKVTREIKLISSRNLSERELNRLSQYIETLNTQKEGLILNPPLKNSEFGYIANAWGSYPLPVLNLIRR